MPSSCFLSLSLWLCALTLPVHAEAPAWLRSENRNVREGNEKLAAGDQKAALEAYDKAARELPSEGGVHLDRGLALMRAGDLPKAREALRLASQPPASSPVRADAYYNLGNAFYKEADARAGENKHDEAQQLFREATDAFKHALRLKPGNHDAAWNLELAARRVREQEEKQKQEQDQNKDKDKDKQDGDQNKDQADKDKDGKDNADRQKDKDKDKAQQDQQKKDQQQQAQKPGDKKQDQKKPEEQKPEQAAVRPEAERALDALQDSEENLERLRAMNRAARERRKPEKDW